MNSSRSFISPPDTDEPQSPQSARGETPQATQARLNNQLIGSNLKLSEEKNQLVVERAELLITQHRIQDENRQLQIELGKQRRINQDLAFELQRRLGTSEEDSEKFADMGEKGEVIKEEEEDRIDGDW